MATQGVDEIIRQMAKLTDSEKAAWRCPSCGDRLFENGCMSCAHKRIGAKLEPGQRAYEAYHGVLRNQRWWHAEGSEDRKAWAAVERACAVPAATQGDGHNEDAAKYRELASAFEWNRRHRGTTLTIDGYLARARELGWDGTIEPTRPINGYCLECVDADVPEPGDLDDDTEEVGDD